eukprot:gene19105-21021_t
MHQASNSITIAGRIICIFFLACGCQLIAHTQQQSCFSKCDIRYEYSKEIHELWNYNTCEDVYKLACICNKSIDILFIDLPPYIYTDAATNKVVGLIPGILDEAFQACCFGCSRMRYLTPFKTASEAMLRINTATLMLPVITHSSATTVVADTFVKLIPTRGVVFVTNEDKNKLNFNKFLISFFSNWRLFFISFLLAVNAGVIIWILDSWKNKEEFPSPFYRGIYEGVWWAYITMTTVGYGDKAPKTLPSKIFAILWVTVGISMTGIFTASVMTGMINALNSGPLSLKELKVGVLNSSRYEYSIAVREDANVTRFGTYTSMKNALKSKEIDGILMDVLILRYFWDDLRAEIVNINARKNAVKNSETAYGFTFPYETTNATNKNWSTFLATFFKENKDNMEILLYNSMKKLPKKLPNFPEDTKALLTSPSLMDPLIMYLGIVTLVIIVFGFIFEKLATLYQRYLSRKVAKWTTDISRGTGRIVRQMSTKSTANSDESKQIKNVWQNPNVNNPGNMPVDRFKEILQTMMEEVEVEVTNRMIEKFYKKEDATITNRQSNNRPDTSYNSKPAGTTLELKEFNYTRS